MRSWFARCRARGARRTNAACEGFFGRLKNELFYARDWLSTSTADFIATLDAYIRWCNNTRITDSLGFRSPSNTEGISGSQLNQSKNSFAPRVARHRDGEHGVVRWVERQTAGDDWTAAVSDAIRNRRCIARSTSCAA